MGSVQKRFCIKYLFWSVRRRCMRLTYKLSVQEATVDFLKSPSYPENPTLRGVTYSVLKIHEVDMWQV